MPIRGIIVTHFSLGFFFANHGFSTSPLRTRLEWKYRGVGRCMAEEPPNEEAGLEFMGEAKGFALPGAGEMSSAKGLLLLLGVPGRMGVVAVEVPEVALPLWCTPSII